MSLPSLNAVPPQFCGLLSSETLEIVAESGQKRFFVHSNVLAAATQSAPPYTTTSNRGGFTKKEINLSAWDGDTVERFLQFLYIGNYQFPESIVEDENEDEEMDEEMKRQDGINTPDTIQSLAEHEELEPTMRDTNALLVHAKIYALAQYKGVEALRVMALERLRAALIEIDEHISQGNTKVTVNFIKLLRYVFSHTSTEEPMRDLVSTFAAENFEKLMDQSEMVHLLGLSSGGDFVELMQKVAKRLYGSGNTRDTEKKLCDREKEIQLWKGRAAALYEKMQLLEAINTGLQKAGKTNAQKTEQLEAKVQELEDANRNLQHSEVTSAGARQLELAQAEAIRRLEISHQEDLRKSELTSEERVRLLQVSHETELRRLNVANEEKIRQLETSHEKELRRSNFDNEERVRLLEVSNQERLQQAEKDVQWLTSVNQARMREVKEVEARAQLLEAKLRRFDEVYED